VLKKKEVPSLGWNSLYHQEQPIITARQVFWLWDLPEEASLPAGVLGKSPAVAGLSLASSVPPHSGGTAPDSHRVPDCLAIEYSLDYRAKLVKNILHLNS
jgi:hypothetical protein